MAFRPRVEAVARLLDANPRAAIGAAATLVDADHSRLDPRGNLSRPRHIASKDGSAKPER